MVGGFCQRDGGQGGLQVLANGVRVYDFVCFLVLIVGFQALSFSSYHYYPVQRPRP